MSAQLNDGNIRKGLRSLRDLTQHLTTRADDSRAAPVFKLWQASTPLSLADSINVKPR